MATRRTFLRGVVGSTLAGGVLARAVVAGDERPEARAVTRGPLGHWFGYYDKLLERARADAPLVALAFECQIFPEVPTQAHDVFMDKVLTEARVIEGRGRADGR